MGLRTNQRYGSAYTLNLSCFVNHLILGREYYRPTDQGAEAAAKKRLEEIKAWKAGKE